MFEENRAESKSRQPFHAIDCSPTSSLMNYHDDDRAPNCNSTSSKQQQREQQKPTNCTGNTNGDQQHKQPALPDTQIGLAKQKQPDSPRKFKFDLKQLSIFRTKKVGGAEEPLRVTSESFVDEEAEQEGFLMATRTGKGKKRDATNGNDNGGGGGQSPIESNKRIASKRKAKLARSETIEEVELNRRKQKKAKSGKSQESKVKSKYSASLMDDEDEDDDHDDSRSVSCFAKMLKFISRKRFYAPLLLVLVYVVAVYCIPFVQIDPKTLEPWPTIPFDYQEGPLKPSTASQFKVEHLFKDQVHGAESLSQDSSGNFYMAIEGGFIVYAHLNRSSPVKKQYLDPVVQRMDPNDLPKLIKIAELNSIKQIPRTRTQRQESSSSGQTTWRRECQLDEQIYGQQLFTPANSNNPHDLRQDFKSNVKISRCSKPLGTRLSPDENYLYVVDTLAGLYRVNLKVPERPYSTQRLVTKLIDFKQSQMVPIVQLDQEPTAEQLRQSAGVLRDNYQLVNVSMKAIDDLVIDYGAGSRSGDLIYMTIASQNWPAVSYIYDALEGRPSGLIMRYDTGSNLLVVLDPNRVAHVRTSATLDGPTPVATNTNDDHSRRQSQPYASPGVPRLDEEDVFDNRPLHFPNGIELTDDRQAILIADTSNKRIIKHYIRGPRSGTSDLWAWTPNLPDNIRRGYDRTTETYWVVGCGKQETGVHVNLFVVLRTWPRLRKFVLKNIYLFGWFVEWLGSNVVDSIGLTNYGHAIRTGSSLCQSYCTGMMVLQYNHKGELIRSIHSREFPNDLVYYSQANELIDANNEEHSLYLGSPAYNYITKLVLPTESFNLPLPQQPPT